ncbi:MAG: O-Antigen ligase [Actinomycetota bacterium]|nr:O-Antigen ligase [Actinomycetota bacterium]
MPPTGSRNPWTLLAAATAFLLPVAYSPSVFATFWSPKAAVLLVAGGFGLARLPVLLRSPLRRPTIAALAFLAVATLSTLVSPDRTAALVGLYNWGTGLVFVACLVGVWALGASVGDDTRLVRHALLAGIGASCAIAVLQAMVDLGLPALEANGRTTGLAGNPVHLGAVAAAGVALCAAGSGWGSLAAVLGFTAAAQLSGTRLAIAVILVAVVVIGLRGGMRRLVPLVVVAAVGLGVGSALAGSAGVQTATSRSTERAFDAASGGGVRVRLEVWAYARHAVLDRPLLGSGPGRFRAATSADRTLPVVRAEGSQSIYADGHNLVVEYAVTTGIIGVLALLWWVVGALRLARGPLAAAALVLLAISLGQPQSVGTTPLLFLAAGAGASRLVERRASSPRPGLLLGLVGSIAALALLVGDASLLRLHDDFDLRDGRRADALLHAWPKPASLLADAHTFEAIREPDPSARAVDERVARDWARTAVARDRADPSLWLNLAEDERVAGLLDDATTHYREALRRDHYSVGALVGLGRVAVARHDNGAAVAWFSRAVAIRANPRLSALIDQLR